MRFLDMIKQYGRCVGPFKNLFPPVICKDGTFISAQASAWHHCYPEEELSNFEYEQFELRTDLDDELLAPFKSNEEYQYDFVDVSVIDAIIEKHDGLDIERIEKEIGEGN